LAGFVITRRNDVVDPKATAVVLSEIPEHELALEPNSRDYPTFNSLSRDVITVSRATVIQDELAFPRRNEAFTRNVYPGEFERSVRFHALGRRSETVRPKWRSGCDILLVIDRTYEFFAKIVRISLLAQGLKDLLRCWNQTLQPSWHALF
jgi:hypothetical protein